jgi:hypothetical protein
METLYRMPPAEAPELATVMQSAVPRETGDRPAPRVGRLSLSERLHLLLGSVASARADFGD